MEKEHLLNFIKTRNMQINKKEAKEQLDRLKADVERLEKIINTPEKSWKDVIDFKSACQYNGDLYWEMEQRWTIAKLTPQQINTLKLEYCISTINEGWKPDWKNSSEYKYYNWWEYKSLAGGWCLYGVDTRFSCSSDSVGLFYQSEEKAKHGAKFFKDMYQIHLG